MNIPRTSMASLLVALAFGCGELDPPGGSGAESGSSTSSGTSTSGPATGSGASGSGDATEASTGSSTPSSSSTSAETRGESSGDSNSDSDSNSNSDSSGDTTGESTSGDTEPTAGDTDGQGCVEPSSPWDWESWPSGALWGSAADDVWSVGPAGALRRFDGMTWAPVELGIPAFIPLSITGSGPDDVYVAASDGRVARFDGAWQLDGEALASPSLAAVGPGTVVAVGEGDTVMVRAAGLWQPQVLPVTASLRAVAGSAPEHVFAVGDGGTVLFWDGAEWEVLPSPTTARLRGVAMLDDASAVAAGDDGVFLRLDADGVTSFAPLPIPYSDLGIRAVWATDPDSVFAISVQSLHYFDGEVWSSRLLPFFDSTAALWAWSAQEIHIGGLQHASLHCRSSP